jgi:hypothetical protein
VTFDAYESWLGIPADRRPPTLYDLLGLAPYESNPAVIDQAAVRRMSKVRQHQLGPHSDLSQEILSELARARLILMDPDRRADYNAKLKTAVAGLTPRGAPASADPSFSAAIGSGDANRGPSVLNEETPSLLASLTLSDQPGATAAVIKRQPRGRMSWWQKWLLISAVAGSHAAVVGAFFYFVLAPPRPDQKARLAPPVVGAAPAPVAKQEPRRLAEPNRPGLLPQVRSPLSDLQNAAIGGQKTGRAVMTAPPSDPWRADMPVAQAEIKAPGEKARMDDKALEVVENKEKGAVARREESPETILKEHGLKLEGTTFILDSEYEILSAWRTLHRSQSDLARAQMLQQRARTPEERQQMIQEAQAWIVELDTQIQELNRNLGEIDRQPWGGLANSMVGGQRRLIQDAKSQCERDQKQMIAARDRLAGQAFNPMERERADHQVREAEESLEEANLKFDKLAAELEGLEKVKQKYKELRANQEVRKAIDDLNTKSKGKLKLGPIPEVSKLGRSTAKAHAKANARARKKAEE